MSFTLMLYSAADCEDTEQTRVVLRERHITFVECPVDDDPIAEHFIIFINHGFRSTPTRVFTVEKFKVIVTEPSTAELDRTLHIVAGLLSADDKKGGNDDYASASRL
ncbi:hypothetical protein [uncultured Chloroflexus sp.]|uniref:hypothetical protein n=1 Tax=uncultured Chloroflexus sp. TaxID=214040 RepID=UPI002609B017|nr:hypothetical protein [uncultured Chloroflexus sp.]